MLVVSMVAITVCLRIASILVLLLVLLKIPRKLSTGMETLLAVFASGSVV